MLIYEEVLRRSAKLGLKTYCMWRKRETGLKNRIRIYLDNLYEMYTSDKEVCDVIIELEKKICEFSFVGFSESKEAVKEFFKPLDKLIDVEKTNFCWVCRDIDYLKNIWESNVKQGVESLECMQKNGLQLSQYQCNPELLLVLIHFFHKNGIHLRPIENNQINLIENVIFPNRKIYCRFREVFWSRNTAKEQFDKFWNYEYPKYVVK